MRKPENPDKVLKRGYEKELVFLNKSPLRLQQMER
jgi:hypothetical protein